MATGGGAPGGKAKKFPLATPPSGAGPPLPPPHDLAPADDQNAHDHGVDEHRQRGPGPEPTPAKRQAEPGKRRAVGQGWGYDACGIPPTTHLRAQPAAPPPPRLTTSPPAIFLAA